MFSRIIRTIAFGAFLIASFAWAQGGKKISPQTPIANAGHKEQRSEWFLRGRLVPGKPSAELRHRAYQAKMRARATHTQLLQNSKSNSQTPSTGAWTPLGPVPLASDATGNGFQDYHQVSGRATAVAIDPADATGNTVFMGGAQGGVWTSTNAASSVANNVTWTPLTDDQATLSIGSIAIQPGNSNPATSVVLVGTGEADNSADSYFGLGMLRSADGGNTWTLIPTANGGSLYFSGLGTAQIAFSTTTPNTVVAAMGATNIGIEDGAFTGNTYPGLYTSTDAGQTWTYDALFSGGAAESTAATSVTYNTAAGLFFAALRYHGFYSSPDAVNWTLLPNQPGASGLLSVTACPANYVITCPIYSGEITVVPGRNEMYVWFISLDSNNNPVDQGIWQSLNSGASWTQINDSGITNCGDLDGCGVQQGDRNLELLAIPNCPNGVQTCTGNPTDLYAGAINLYKCSITSINPTCAATPFINLTHAYGCIPLGSLAHVHPGQHALAYTIPATAADLMYFANDGGIYRALNGFTGLNTGSCLGTNQFDDLNQNLGSMTQFVSFSQHATNPNILLGGTQDNGSPATATATTSSSWGNVLSNNGGYNAIDPNTENWFATNQDNGGGTLNIQECPSGINCTDSLFNPVVSSNDVGGDDGAFYFPYILDPQSASSLLVGTCRIWSGPRTGGPFTALSLNFETFGVGTCSGTEVNTVSAIAAGGPANASGSEVVYATTNGSGINNISTPVGGNVWVTTNATAVSGTTSTFTNVTLNGPLGASINPNQFPISDVAIDTSDPSGNTAYVTVMGFTGGPGHVWQTTNAGASWTDFTGTASAAIPDSPSNAVVVDPVAHTVYVGTDVGVFQSSTATANWTEVGPIPGSPVGGFLPNVAVTALALFNSGGQKLLRASTYGRGIWQFNLLATPDFQIDVSNTPLTVFPGTTAIFSGTLVSINGYNNPVNLSCTSNPPTPCTPSPANLTPTESGAPFTLTVGDGLIGESNFNLQGVGTDPNGTTHLASLTLDVVDLTLSAPSPSTITEPRGAPSPPVSFQVTAQGAFNQNVTLSCTFAPVIPGAACAFTPGAVVNVTSSAPVNMTVSVTVPDATPTGNYTVTLQATASESPAPQPVSFTMAVVLNPNFNFTPPPAFPTLNADVTYTSGTFAITPQDGFSSTVNLTCLIAGGSCTVTPTSVSSFPNTALTITVNTTGLPTGSNQLTVQGVSGSITKTFSVTFIVANYSLCCQQTINVAPGGQGTANLSLTSTLYSGQVTATFSSTLSGVQFAINPPSPITVASGATIPITLSVNIPTNAVPNTYSLTINTQDVSGNPVQSLTLSLTVGQDFTIGTITPATQTIAAGGSANYNFSVLPVGSSFNNAVALACSGQPTLSLCSFSPSSVTPGGTGGAAVVLTIGTTSTASNARPRIYYALWLAFPGLLLFHKNNRRKLPASLLGLLLLAFLLLSCGGGGTNGGGGGGGTQQQGTQPGTYTITVTGTSGALTHQASPVTLIVTQ